MLSPNAELGAGDEAGGGVGSRKELPAGPPIPVRREDNDDPVKVGLPRSGFMEVVRGGSENPLEKKKRRMKQKFQSK
jgi:hypothetical protein